LEVENLASASLRRPKACTHRNTPKLHQNMKLHLSGAAG